MRDRPAADLVFFAAGIAADAQFFSNRPRSGRRQRGLVFEGIVPPHWIEQSTTSLSIKETIERV
jgi:hypothetical protein